MYTVNVMNKSTNSFANNLSKVAEDKWKPNYIGIIFLLITLLFSLLPSLMPRPWYIQGFISGLSAVIGYGIGLAVSATYRWLVQKEMPRNIKHRAWNIILILSPTFTIGALFLGRIWQNQVRDLLEVERIGVSHSLLVVGSTAVFGLLFFYLGRMLRYLTRKIQRYYDEKLPKRLSIFLALLTILVIIYLVVSGLLFRSFLSAADSIFGYRDNTTPIGASQPKSKNRSGSTGSYVAWEKIGFQGRAFVGTGPTQNEIESFSGQTALDPIRVYAGLKSADSAEERADLAVKELRRTNAFDRDVLVIATATGTGWLDPYVVDSLELMHKGNTAIVSQQYSYLPSWISFLVDQARAREAGRVLYDAVIEEWSALPVDERPKLIVYGLSLGSFGGQEAFSGVNDIRRSVDGALFTGTPNETELWRTITDNRESGSPEWQPKYQSGSSVVFASSREDIIAINPPKNDTRVLFLQHANDPVVWFNFNLLLHKPDWLKEKRGRAVSPQTRWYPVVTFLQIGLDQAIAASAPLGHGHYYQDTAAHAWATVVPPNQWSTGQSDKVQSYLLNQYDKSQSSL